MKLKLKKIKELFIKYKADIIDFVSILLAVVLGVGIGYYSCFSQYATDHNVSLSTDSVALCSFESGSGNDYDYPMYKDDYIVLNSPIFNYDGSQFRAVGSLFLGYTADGVVLYYPNTADSVTVKYVSTLVNFNTNQSILLACAQSGYTQGALTFRCNIYLGSEDNSLSSLSEGIYFTNGYSFNSSSVDVSTLDNNYIGYTNFNIYNFDNYGYYDYYFEIYNTARLNTNQSNYVGNYSFIPATHIRELVGFDEAYDLGYTDGYDVGYSEGVLGDSPLDVIVNGANDLLKIEIFDGFRISDLFLLAFTVALFGILMKVFRF